MTKVANFSTDHPYALIRGWVESTASVGAGIGVVTQRYLNNTAGVLIAGDVVVIDSSADAAVTTTTTAQDTRIVGIVQDTIEVGAIGPVLTAGFAPYVNVTAAVTRGYFAETSTTAKKATENVARRAGSFGVYLTGGTAPSCLLFGGGDSSGGSGSGGPGVASSLRVITPTQLVANTNNWNPTGLSTADVIRASTDASRNLTGITAPAAARLLILLNIGAFDLVLIHDATSTAANRFLCPDDADMTLPPDSGVFLFYDVTTARWRVIGGTGSGGGGGSAAAGAYAETIGDTSNTTFTINHNLGTNDVVVLVYRTASPFDQVFPEVDLTDADNLDVVFSVAPGTDEYRVVVLGTGTIGHGTAFPGSPSTDDRFFRDDLHMDFFYDGTRWLTTTLYSLVIGTGDSLTPVAATTAGAQRVGYPWTGDFDIYVENSYVDFFVSGGTALSGSHKWVGTISDLDGTLATITINSGASNADRNDVQSLNTVRVKTTAGRFICGWAKTGTPGAIYAHATLSYRIVGT